MNIYETHSTDETEAIGEVLGQSIIKSKKEHAFVALFGAMGVGKTAFVRGFARAFGVRAVKSPTYTVVNEYKGTPIPLFHFDMYRLSDIDDLYSIGYEDYLTRRGVILSEWSEKITSEIPSDAVRVMIRKTDDGDGRQIEIGGSYADLEL